MFSWCFLFVSRYFSIVRNLSREPDFSAMNRFFEEFLKKPQNMFSWCFLSVSWYFSIIRHMSREPDFSAKNRIFKNFLKSLKACLVGVFWVFQSIFSIARRLGREPDFQKFLKKPQNMFNWCFLSVSRYFSIVQNLCWEPHFWAENRIFKNFSNSLKTCFVGVFWVFQCIF